MSAPEKSSPRLTFRKRIYLSPLGWLISLVLRLIAPFCRPIMIFGYYNRVARRFNRLTRISSTASLISKQRLDIADDTFVWHYTIIDASNGVRIGRGCQIGAWVGIFTHSSHLSIRLEGANYFAAQERHRAGWGTGSVEIGEYTFVGAQSLILPGARIGRGCILTGQSVVTGDVPDYAIVSGNPARVIGDTRRLDRLYLTDPQVRAKYYAPDILGESGLGSAPDRHDVE